MNAAELASLLDSFPLHLRGERKSPQTVKTYTDGVRGFLAWCGREGIEPVLDRPTVDKWVAALLDGGDEAATARSRQLAVRRFSAWLAEEDEIPADELARLRPPKLDAEAIHALEDDQLRALLAACKGPELRDKRDEAIIRLMTETGARAGEVLALAVGDVNPAAGTAVIRYTRAAAYAAALGPHARWGSPAKVYRAAGLTPARCASAGRRRDGAISREGSARLRRALIGLGMGLWQKDPAARAYAAALRERGQPGGIIACALAHRAGKIAFAMARDHAPYDPARWS